MTRTKRQTTTNKCLGTDACECAECIGERIDALEEKLIELTEVLDAAREDYRSAIGWTPPQR